MKKIGLIKWIVPEKKGCIAQSSGARDILFDFTDVVNSEFLHKGQHVTYLIVNDSSGQKAVLVESA